MQKVWNIGNTTVRNPKRIEQALKIFFDEGFSGNAKGSEIEKRIHYKLKEKGILEFDGEPSDWNGRKWRSAFYQLGFISYEKYKISGDVVNINDLFHWIDQSDISLPYQLTLAGSKIINSSYIPEIEEIYARQFLCYEIPNALENNFPDGKMKPFILFLQVLNELNNRGENGLNKFETGLFLQLFQDHTNDLHLRIVDKIIEYRRSIINCRNNNEKKEIKKRYSEELGSQCGINPSSVTSDYADTTFRYFYLTGLFSRINDTIVIRQSKRDFVNQILNEEPLFLYDADPIDYFRKYYNNSYPLPIDKVEYCLQDISLLAEGIRNRSNELLIIANNLTLNNSMSEIQNCRYSLIEYHNWEREEDFANEQRSDDSIKDILNYLKVLNGDTVSNRPEIDDKPAYLEWAVWRSFLAIDEIVSKIYETRRFPVDQDFNPRNTAPGGGADLIFEFENYFLIVEVTLTTSNRQMAVESEPVRRHTAQYKLSNLHKDVYCLFIAPEIDNNVAETFRIGVWYNNDDEVFLNIIPLKLNDFIRTIEILLERRYSNNEFKNLLDRCLICRNVRAPLWKQNITLEVENWINRITV